MLAVGHRSNVLASRIRGSIFMEGSMSDDLRTALAKLTPEDVTIDPFGRLIVTNLELSDALKKIGVEGRIAAAADNYGCCKNGVACGKAVAELL